MNCTQAEAHLADYCAGDLQDPLRAEVEAHLRSCAECSALGAALDDVLAMLRAARNPLWAGLLEPAPGLADRAASAALRAGRAADRGRAWTVALPRRVQTLAAALAIFGTAAVWAGHGAFDRGWPQRVVRQAATAGVRLIERKDRAVEDLRMLRVMVAATFAGRVDRVGERVDDYKRLLERRRPSPAPPPAGQEAPPPAITNPNPPARGSASPAPGPVSAVEPASWAVQCPQSSNQDRPPRV